MCMVEIKAGGDCFFSIPDPSEVFQTRRGGAIDPHTRLPGYTQSTILGVTQVWYVAHHVGHVMKTLRMGRLDELHRRMKRNPHVLDARVCRAVLWWSLLGEAMKAAREADKRRSSRRENRRLVVALAITQRRGSRPMNTNRRWSLPPAACREDSRRCGECGERGESGELRVWGRRAMYPHLDEAAILTKVYEFL
ncbi:unnamed protein product [Ascophyllum nodosum]